MKLKIVALIALIASPVYAVLPPFPVGEKCVLDQEEARCYNFAGGKALKLYQFAAEEADQGRTEAQTELTKQVARADLLNKAFQESSVVNGSLRDMLSKTQAERNEALEKAAVAEGHSVFGGGFVFILLAGGLGIAAGAVGGWYLGTHLIK